MGDVISDRANGPNVTRTEYKCCCICAWRDVIVCDEMTVQGHVGVQHRFTGDRVRRPIDRADAGGRGEQIVVS